MNIAYQTTSDELLNYALSKTNDNISGSKITYCVDTDDTCNPTINYTEEVNVNNTGTYYFRYKILAGNGKSNTYSYQAIVNANKYCPINLIENGSFEENKSFWTWGGLISSDTSYYGNKSFLLGGDATLDSTGAVYEQYWNDGYEIKPNGKLYCQTMYYSTNAQVLMWLINNDWESVNLAKTISGPPSTLWRKVSIYHTNTTNENKKFSIRIENNNVQTNVKSYFDGILCIDLTDTFGEGNEPDQAWCDSHIDYFDGKTILYK